MPLQNKDSIDTESVQSRNLITMKDILNAIAYLRNNGIKSSYLVAEMENKKQLTKKILVHVKK